MRRFVVAAVLAMMPEAGTSAVLVQNRYYPKAGYEEAVLATRLEASEVRTKLGLPAGVVLLRKNATDGSALVIWECEYPTLEARLKDASAAESAPAFKAVQAKMRPLLDKFERVTWNRADD